MPKPNSESDFKESNYITRIEDLETFKSEFEGKSFDKKVEASIEDSTGIQKRIKVLVWETVREKLVWILLTLVALLLWDVLRGVLG